MPLRPRVSALWRRRGNANDDGRRRRGGGDRTGSDPCIEDADGGGKGAGGDGEENPG